MREVLVGCVSGFYNYGPSPAEMKRAKCTPTKVAGKRNAVRCAMPHGNGGFVLAPGRKGRMLEHALATFTLITIDGANIDVAPMTLDADGHPTPFYLPPEPPAPATASP